MGMFDTVTFHYRMRDGVTGTEFQTKDLDCQYESYEMKAACCAGWETVPAPIPVLTGC